MNPYLDGGFLLTLFAKTPGTAHASALLREIPTPIAINFLHQLQVENLLIRFQKDSNPDIQAGGNTGQRHSHFFSFDPRCRLLARSHGIKVLPQEL